MSEDSARGDRVEQAPVDLATHRQGAAMRAPLWFAVGVAIAGVVSAAAVLVALAGAARLWSLVADRPITDAPVWQIVGPSLALAALATASLLGGVLALSVWRGAPGAIRREVGARPVHPGDPAVLTNVVGALAIGLGVPPPEVLVVDDPAPNALSARAGSRRTIIATTGLATLPRPQVEAVLAHEMAHLYGPHTRWLTAAAVSLGATRALSAALEAVGTVLAAAWLFAGDFGVMTYTPIAAAITLFALGALVRHRVGQVRRRLRAEQDAVADVAAIGLAGHPAALGQACRALAADARTVVRSGWRSDLAWFKAVRTSAMPERLPDEGTSVAEMDPDVAGAWATTTDPTAGNELLARAAVAYRVAQVPLPGP